MRFLKCLVVSRLFLYKHDTWYFCIGSHNLSLSVMYSSMACMVDTKIGFINLQKQYDCRYKCNSSIGIKMIIILNCCKCHLQHYCIKCIIIKIWKDMCIPKEFLLDSVFLIPLFKLNCELLGNSVWSVDCLVLNWQNLSYTPITIIRTFC